MDNFSFVALDIETATGKRSSICEIGITIVKDSKIAESKSWLIQPKDNSYWRRNIEIHGINPEDTQDKPTLADIWEEIKGYIEKKTIIAHNTAFDMYAIADALAENGIPLPDLDYFCSLRIAQKTFSLLRYSLSPLCASLGISFDQCHRAGSDSEACAKVMLKCLDKLNVSTFNELEEKLKIKRGNYKEGAHCGQKSIAICNGKKNYCNTADPKNFDPSNYFYGKVVMFTGKMRRGKRDEMRTLIDNIGGHSVNSFNDSVEVLVEGTQTARNLKEDGKSDKQRKCEEKLAKGGSIEILTEDEFYERLGIWNE